MSHEDIRVERAGSWCEITLDRPEKLNALRERTAGEILDALAGAEFDRDIHAVIFAGSERAFCTGVDAAEFRIEPGGHFDFYRYRRRAKRINRLFRELPDFTKPVICAVEGYALGGGLELALCGDILVAGSNARFGLPEARLGLMPGGGGTQTLPRLVGRPLAKEMIWTGRRLTAEEALSYRLVNHVTAEGGALDKAREIAAAIGASAPLSVMLSKGVIDRGMDMSLADGMTAEADVSFLLQFSADRDEGLAAFREKRSARFKGE